MAIKSCSCKSKKPYTDCCKPFHQGVLPSSALQLMRSRYSAYALCLPEYILSTTHLANPQDRKQIIEFCKNTQFNDLKILDFQEEGNHATVTFTAYLSQNKRDISFTEKSTFEKIEGKWLYTSGQIY